MIKTEHQGLSNGLNRAFVRGKIVNKTTVLSKGVKMKIFSLFQCEICNTVYKSETECSNCEQCHQLPSQIVVNKFNSYKNGGNYPNYIEVQMTDGKNIRYKRS